MTTHTRTEEKTTVVDGTEAMREFAQFLSPRAKAVQTPCEGFATIQLGHFQSNEDNVTGASLVKLESGGEHPQHLHNDSENTFYFIEGNGNVILGEEQEKVPYSPGTVIKALRGVLHGFQPFDDGLMLALHKGGPIIRPDGTMDIHYIDPRCFTKHGTVGGD
jgi:quercetin dioxygenase-like cupin family protein